VLDGVFEVIPDPEQRRKVRLLVLEPLVSLVRCLGALEWPLARVADLQRCRDDQ
jgi:hypothetical protein